MKNGARIINQESHQNALLSMQNNERGGQNRNTRGYEPLSGAVLGLSNSIWKDSIYLDYNATTPLDPIVRNALLPFLENQFGNPSSTYKLGAEASIAISKARTSLATLLGASSSEMIFNSGATEAITTAFLSALQANPNKRHIVTSSVEHHATLELCRYYETCGYEVTYLPVDEDGNLSLSQVEEAITSNTALISLLWGNNETGVLFPIEEIAAIVASKKSTLHIDAVQAVGKIPINLASTPIHYLSLSGHKIYAPKGIGALYVHRHAFYRPLLLGSQENERRGGTENVASIVALGKAAELASFYLAEEAARETKLRLRLEEELVRSLKKVQLNGNKTACLPNTSNFTFEGIQAAEALLLLDREGLYCSAGSACNTTSQTPSPVLNAMGRTSVEARASLRISLGRFTTEEEIDRTLEIIPRIIKKLRSL